jgi:hypothetical protein
MAIELEGHEAARGVPRRLPVDLPATITVVGAPSQLGRVVNLTLRGAFVATPTPAAPGMVVDLALSLPSAAGVRRVAVRARVRWTNEAAAPRSAVLPPGMGVQFVEIDPAVWDALLAFVAGHLGSGAAWATAPDR